MKVPASEVAVGDTVDFYTADGKHRRFPVAQVMYREVYLLDADGRRYCFMPSKLVEVASA